MKRILVFASLFITAVSLFGAPVAHAQKTSGCGPAPSCQLLIWTWCGCPWGSIARSQDETLVQEKCFTIPNTGKPLSDAQVKSFLEKLASYPPKSADCTAPDTLKAYTKK